MISLTSLIITFFVAIGVQIVFYILFLVAFSRSYKESNQSHSVSVIVCAHNEESNLRQLIPILLSQDHPHYEVIIVEDRSNDGTFDFLKEEIKKDTRLRMVRVDYLPEHVNAKKYGLSLAIKVARNEIILLTDADCRPEGKNWIDRMVQKFEGDTQFVLGYSPYFKGKGFLNLFIRFETLMTGIQYLSMALIGMPYMGVGRNLAYRRSVFMDNKGFRNLIGVTGGDDDLFVNRHARSANTKVCIAPETLVYSIPKTTWKAFFKQKLRHFSVGTYYRKHHKWVLGLFISSFIVSWLAGITLVFICPIFYWIIIAIFFRLVLVVITIRLASNKLGDKFQLWPVFFLDFLYAIYYLSNGLRALITRKVTWTN